MTPSLAESYTAQNAHHSRYVNAKQLLPLHLSLR